MTVVNGWRRACDTSACAEVLNDGDRVLVRNSVRPMPVVEFTREEWAAFVAAVKRGKFDSEVIA